MKHPSEPRRGNYGYRAMGRLCERPGCSEDAAVAYGMRAEDLVFWLDAIGEGPGPDRGVLCQRHGDSMVVPRGWTLDDLRDPDLHLFRPPGKSKGGGGGSRTKRPRASGRTVAEQLALDADPDTADDAADLADDAVDAGVDAGDEREPAAPWKPSFDDADDLDGLLDASSPLLSRAFRTTDRPD